MNRSDIGAGRKIAFALAITIALLALGEGIARFARVPDPRFPRGRDVFIAIGGLTLGEVDQIIDGDADLFWRFKPNLHGRPWLKPLWLDTRTNSLGLRSPEVSRPKPADHFRVLALGDSCTYGSGVPSGDTYPARLEQMLNSVYEDGVFEVVNGGCPGYTSYQGIQFLKQLGLSLEPDVVTISFGINDASPWTGASDADVHARLNPPLLSSLLKSALLRSLAAVLLRWGNDGSPAFARADAAAATSALPRASPEQFAAQLGEIVDLVRARGAQPVLIVQPLKAQVDHDLQAQLEQQFGDTPYQAMIRSVASDKHVVLCDLVKELDHKPQVFIDNCHLKAEGCQLAAAALFRVMKSAKLVPEPPTLEQRRAIRARRGASDGD
ncbi:MAG: SGNH/GDSL hydrolase family protein [Planctomycetota bacterium]